MIRHGVTQLNQTKSKGQTFQIEKIFIHPKYNETGYFDIAVLQIAPVNFNLHLRPICLPNPSDFRIDQYYDRASTLIGWGSKESAGTTSPTLKRIILTIYDDR